MRQRETESYSSTQWLMTYCIMGKGLRVALGMILAGLCKDRDNEQSSYRYTHACTRSESHTYTHSETTHTHTIFKNEYNYLTIL